MLKKFLCVVFLSLLVSACKSERGRELVEQGIESFEVTYVDPPKRYTGEFTPVNHDKSILEFTIRKKRCSNWEDFKEGTVYNIPYSMYIIYYDNGSKKVLIEYDLSKLKICGNDSYRKYM